MCRPRYSTERPFPETLVPSLLRHEVSHVQDAAEIGDQHQGPAWTSVRVDSASPRGPPLVFVLENPPAYCGSTPNCAPPPPPRFRLDLLIAHPACQLSTPDHIQCL
jgi:hypothetical protein